MAKGKRSNSPKKSRRGGRRSPKKNRVQKAISKGESEPAQLHAPANTEVEEPDCECELSQDVEQELFPKIADEVPIADLTVVKESLVQFFWNSLTEDAQASTKLLSQLDESLFFFGKVAAELAKCDQFTDEVEGNLALVWKAEEAWIRSFLAGEVEPAKPEEPEQAEEPAPIAEVEAVPEETVEAEVEPEQNMEIEAGAEVAAEIQPETVVETAEASEEKVEVFEDVAMTGVVEDVAVAAEESIETVDAQGLINNENAEAALAEAAMKAVASKLGEPSSEDATPMASLVPKDLNVVQQTEFA